MKVWLLKENCCCMLWKIECGDLISFPSKKNEKETYYQYNETN